MIPELRPLRSRPPPHAILWRGWLERAEVRLKNTPETADLIYGTQATQLFGIGTVSTRRRRYVLLQQFLDPNFASNAGALKVR